jgi:hypothetical protein
MGNIERAFGCVLLAVLLVAPAWAEDLVSPSYPLRGVHVAGTGPGWLTSTATIGWRTPRPRDGRLHDLHRLREQVTVRRPR